MGSVFTISTVSDAVSLAPYPSKLVTVAVIVEPTGRELSKVSVEPVPKAVPDESVHEKVVERFS